MAGNVEAATVLKKEHIPFWRGKAATVFRNISRNGAKSGTRADSY